MMTSVFWNITQYNPLKFNGGFGGTYRLRLQNEMISTAPLPPDLTFVACLDHSWTIEMETICPKRRFTWTRLHGVIYKKAELYVVILFLCHPQFDSKVSNLIKLSSDGIIDKIDCMCSCSYYKLYNKWLGNVIRQHKEKLLFNQSIFLRCYLFFTGTSFGPHGIIIRQYYIIQPR
jgi:hypothetical protein